MVVVAQLVRAPGCGPGGRGFKSPQPPHSPLSLDGFVALISLVPLQSQTQLQIRPASFDGGRVAKDLRHPV